MEEYQKNKILMLVKTYPHPSQKYQETVCTAGITEKGKLIRLYPVMFRYLDDSQQFKKYTWIEASIAKNESDYRPESYKIDYDTIKILNRLDASEHNYERCKIIEPHISKSYEKIQEKHKESGISLGIFKPRNVLDISVEEAKEKEWTEKELFYLNQISLFEKNISPLEKIPYKFKFKFKFVCDDESCKGHNMTITDWELCQTYRNFKKLYGNEEGIRKLKDKWLGMFKDKNTDFYFIVGTVYRTDRFGTFIIIGYVNLKKDDQLNLFDLT